MRACSKLDSLDQSRAVTELQAVMPELAAQLRREMVTFADVARLDDRVLQKFIAAFPSEEWARALQGADEALVNTVVNNMSERARAILREDLQFYQHADTADIMRSRENIVSRLRQQRAGR